MSKGSSMTEYTSEALYTIDEHETCLSAVRDLAATSPDGVLFKRPKNFDWVDVTVAEFLEDVYAVGKGLVANGIEPGDRVVIMSDTRYEWTVLDYGIWAAGAITVPIYPSSSTSQCEWIVGNSGAKLAIAEKSGHTTRLSSFVKEGDRPEGDTSAHLNRVLEINSGAIDILVNDGKEAGIEQDLSLIHI